MERAQASSMDLRKGPRAQLRMPVRLRWQGSLGMRLEITETLDVSKEGMLVRRSDSHGVGSRVWLAFPFDPTSSNGAQPETPAQVVRIEPETAGGYRVALKLELPRRNVGAPEGMERRKAPRVPFALPIFVRPKDTPWPEESMTRDISKYGALLDSSHVYRVGDSILAKIPWGNWSNIGEVPGRVVRVQMRGDMQNPPLDSSGDSSSSTVLRSVAVEWTPEPKAESKAESKPETAPAATSAATPAEESASNLPAPRFKLL